MLTRLKEQYKGECYLIKTWYKMNPKKNDCYRNCGLGFLILYCCLWANTTGGRDLLLSYSFFDLHPASEVVARLDTAWLNPCWWHQCRPTCPGQRRGTELILALISKVPLINALPWSTAAWIIYQAHSQLLSWDLCLHQPQKGIYILMTS